MSKAKPKVPAGLGERGRRFWRDTVAVFELERDERELLVEACRTLDAIEDLQAAVAADGTVTRGAQGQLRAHPALSELRHNRAALGRLLAQLSLPDEGGDSIDSPAQARARKAANVRWALERERRNAPLNRYGA